MKVYYIFHFRGKDYDNGIEYIEHCIIDENMYKKLQKAINIIIKNNIIVKLNSDNINDDCNYLNQTFMGHEIMDSINIDKFNGISYFDIKRAIGGENGKISMFVIIEILLAAKRFKLQNKFNKNKN
jgi:hypothetical protein